MRVTRASISPATTPWAPSRVRAWTRNPFAPTSTLIVPGVSVIETLGVGLILGGLLLQAGVTLVAAKLVIVGLLIFFASPTASHALARAASVRGLRPLLAEPGEPPSKRS